MTTPAPVPARHVDIRLDGLVIDGRHLSYPVLLTELAGFFDNEPLVTRASRRKPGRWWWRHEGVTAHTPDEVHAERVVFAVTGVEREVRVEGVPYGEEFSPTGPTYPSRDFATGYLMAVRSQPGPVQQVEKIVVQQQVPRRQRSEARGQAGAHPPPRPVVFTDLNLKLAVVQVLMYEKGLLAPAFEVEQFVATCTTREIDLVAEGHEPVPEVLAHFAALEIPEALLSEVEEIVMDGGNEVYMQVAPHWSGEDGAFDVASWDDLDRLPRLRHVTVMGGDDETVRMLRGRGLDAELL